MGDWFKSLFGFKEAGYALTQAQFAVAGPELVCHATNERFYMGEFSTPSLAELRQRVAALPGAATVSPQVPRLQLLFGLLPDGGVGDLFYQPENAGATFQAASQFNTLGMFLGVFLVVGCFFC